MADSKYVDGSGTLNATSGAVAVQVPDDGHSYTVHVRIYGTFAATWQLFTQYADQQTSGAPTTGRLNVSSGNAPADEPYAEAEGGMVVGVDLSAYTSGTVEVDIKLRRNRRY